MASQLERVSNLIALAVDKASSPEEARTAALQAVRLIHKHKFLNERVEPRSTSPGPHTYDPKQACGGWRIVPCPNRALCGSCNRLLKKDDPIMFLSGEPYMHPTCWEYWARVHWERSR